MNACDLSASPAACSVIASGLPTPTAMAFGLDGQVWVTTNSLTPALAQVIPLP